MFWSNRLDFVAEMDVISNGFNQFKTRDGDVTAFDEENATAREMWKKFIFLFDDVDDHGIISVEFIMYFLLRLVTACFIIPLWLVLGFITCGILWPPQIREKLLRGRFIVHSKAAENRNRMNQVTKLRHDISTFHEEVLGDIGKGRNEINAIKALLDSSKTEIHSELNNVKEIVTELFECLTSM